MTLPHPAARGRLGGRAIGRRWGPGLSALVLAVPFAVMVVVLHHMTVALAVFHGTDEISYQYPTILQFSRHLPFPELHRYPAAQTPLFHLLMAYVGKLTGYQLWRLRLVEVIISYLLVLAVLRFLLRRLDMTLLQATVLALLFELSPYVFGQSFRLVTDNLALLFLVLALDAFEGFRERRRLGAFVLGCALTALAVLTRQSTGFLWGVAALYLIFPGGALGLRARLLGLGALLLSIAPAAALFINWHGLVPVGGDPSSCGLCVASGHGHGLSTGGLEVQTAELALAAIGFYGVVMFLPFLREWLGGMRRDVSQLGALVAGIAAGVVLLLAFPAVPGVHAAGTIWKVAAKLPAPDGTSLLFWGLVPASLALLALRIPRSPRPVFVAVLALCFLVSDVAIRFPWEKYTDPLALLVVIATVGARQLVAPRRLWGVALLAAFFIAYVADTGSHGAALPTGSPAADVSARR